MSYLKHALMLIILGVLLAPSLHSVWQAGTSQVSPALWVLAGLSAAVNLFPLFYHATSATHPKYGLLRKRRLALRLHIGSGVLEILVGFWAAASHAAPLPVRIMAMLALCIQVPSSLYQTPIVFGAKAVMWPAYLFAITLHAYCAVRMLLVPSVYCVVQTFLAVHIYVWVRFFYATFRLFDVFQGTLYTSAIIAAGLVIIPAILGPLGPILAFGFILGYIVLYRVLFQPSLAQYRALTRELQMDTLIPQQVAELFEAPSVSSTPERNDVAAARSLFTQLDVRRQGALDAHDVESLLGRWDLPPRVIQSFIARHSNDGGFDFACFYHYLWRVDRLRRQAQALPRARTDRERARMVFARLDLDRSGVLESYELESLLLEWGLPSEDVHACLTAASGLGPVDFETFLRRFEPVWQFGYELLRPDRETEYKRLIARNVETAIARMRAPRRSPRARTFDTAK